MKMVCVARLGNTYAAIDSLAAYLVLLAEVLDSPGESLNFRILAFHHLSHVHGNLAHADTVRRHVVSCLVIQVGRMQQGLSPWRVCAGVQVKVVFLAFGDRMQHQARSMRKARAYAGGIQSIGYLARIVELTRAQQG